jgi:hypothetical protein
VVRYWYCATERGSGDLNIAARLLPVTALELQAAAARTLLVATQPAELFGADGYECADTTRVDAVLVSPHPEAATVRVSGRRGQRG